MKFILPTIALLTAMASFAVAEDKAPTTMPTTQSSSTPINKFCAVMPDDPIDPDVTTEYKGKTVAFCCKHCIDDFKKDPEKYMAKIK